LASLAVTRDVSRIFSELPPKIVTTMKDTTVTSKETAYFDIELSKGDARVQWFKDDVEIQFSQHIQLLINGKKQKLVVVNCKEDDAGNYSCVVGKEKSVGRLTVMEGAFSFGIPRKIIYLISHYDSVILSQSPRLTF